MAHLLHIPLFKKIHPAAFHTAPNCPYCNPDGKKKSRWQYIENITPYRIRYRCKDCGHYMQYDFSNRAFEHPYSPFKKDKWQKLINLPKRQSS